MKVSIVMATYNGSKYIQEQLDSFSCQTRLPDELIISDDCSTDDTINICNAFKSTATFNVLIFRNEKNLGYAKNFENAILKSTGDVVFISDQDDVWYADKIELIINQFENTDKNLIIHDLEYCNEKLEPINETAIKRIKSFMDLESSYIVGMATVVRRPFVDVCLPIPVNECPAHDSWLHICASLTNQKLVFEKTLSYYRRHETNVTSSYDINTPNTTSSFHFFKISIKKIFNPVDISEFKATILLNNKKIEWLSLNNEKLIKQKVLREGESIKTISNIVASNKLREQRVKVLLEENNIVKALSSISFFLSGGYNEFNGYKSLFKDIFVRSVH